tara:strand:+ start:4567 stop:6213 length:1647 start_codon:yes stop_codon:yes gene_type:complete
MIRSLHIMILLFLSLNGCKSNKVEVEYGTMTISREQTQSWVRNFNPLAPGASARWPTNSGIYEPLFIYNTMTNKVVPWLGTGYSWKQENRILDINIRNNVFWSDDKPFSAYDVEFTFKLKKDFPALDGTGNWEYLSSVIALDSSNVRFTFSRVYVPGFDVIASQPIIPKHIWDKIEDPVKFTNPNPVGTGPFTEILKFKNQVWELGRNNNYWQQGKPKIEKLRFPAFLSNEQATIALISGEVDWSGNFIPAIDRIYVEKDPENNHYWFPQSGTSIFLYLNTTMESFKNKEFRKAISMAINRDLIVKVAMYNYTSSAHQTALSGTFENFRLPDEKIIENWISYNPIQSQKIIEELGYKKNSSGFWLDRNGQPIEIEIGIVSGWSDWIRAGQIISSNLKDIGIKTRVKTQDFGAWFNNLQTGNFSAAIGWTEKGATPYPMFEALMASKNVKDIGEISGTNWHRFGLIEIDSLISEFEKTSNQMVKNQIIFRMQELFIDNAPAIPIFADPSWGVYSTKRFENFPNEDNPYAQISPNSGTESLFILTEVVPK